MQNDPALMQRPFWWVAAEPYNQLEAPVAEQCDVAVVGAGYTGLAGGLILARAGRSVQIFDRQRPGEGASSRNGGITSGSIRTTLENAIAKLGVTRAVGLFREGMEARKALARFIEDEQIDCDFQLNGRFTGALTGHDFDDMQREADLLNKHLDVGATIIQRDKLHEEAGTNLYVGGVVLPDIGHFHPGKFHAGLYEKVIAAGATVHGETAVQAIEKVNGKFLVRTSRGTTRAAHLLVATNGYTDGVDPWLRRRMIPINSRIVVTETLSPNLMRHLLPKSRAMGEARNLYRYYRPSPDGTRIVLGSRETMWSGDPATNAEHVRRGLVEIFPELADTQIEYSWNGQVAFSRDELPRLFEHEGAIYACGYCGSGTVWARWLGEKAAHRILGNAEESRTVFDGPPPKAVPFFNGKPWFIPFAIGLQGVQDRRKGRFRRA